MKTYKHDNLIYYYDTNLRLWAVYADDLESDPEYFNNKDELVGEYPDFEFVPLNEDKIMDKKKKDAKDFFDSHLIVIGLDGKDNKELKSIIINKLGKELK